MATLTVQDASLTKMADALRAGTGTTEPLTFPEEFVSQINILAAIGGGGMITPEDIGAATADHTHSAEDIGAAKADHTHTPASIGAAQEEHTHTPESIGAATKTHTHTANDIGAAKAEHTHDVVDIIGAVSIEKLWENASVASEFNAQTLSIDLTDYDMVLIRFRTPNDELDTGSAICEVGARAGLSTTTYSNNTLYYYYRAATITRTGIEFGAGWYNKAGSSTTSNTGLACAPVSIYGIKGVK